VAEGVDLELNRYSVWLAIYLIALQFFNLFNSQFLLPVYHLQDRWRIYRSLNNFIRGVHGPLIFVRDGEIISHLGERERAGPGVVLINSNSAVVVGNQIYGPGIAFTGGRRIGMVMDLRKQIRTQKGVRAVTRDGIEIETDLSIQFSISAPPEIVYICVKKPGTMKEHIRVLDVDGDGKILNIQEPNFHPEELHEIYTTLQRENIGDKEGIPYYEERSSLQSRFDAQRVRTAFTNQLRRPDSGERVDWRDLPLALAIEEFRNLIVRFPFDDLYIRPDVGSDPWDQVSAASKTGSMPATAINKKPPTYEERLRRFPLATIRREYSNRVRATGYVAYALVERKDGGSVEEGQSLKDAETRINDPILLAGHPMMQIYQRPLRQSRITVSKVSFGEVIPASPEVRNQKIQNLIARWNADAFRTEVGFEEQAAMIRSRAKAQVQQDTVYALRDLLRKSDTAQTAVILRIFQALEAATSSTDNAEMARMMQMLRDLREWFR
jgi:hypothetical protein